MNLNVFSKLKIKSDIVNLKDVYIAVMSLVLILLHVTFLFTLNTSSFLQNLPLYLVLMIGGIPMICHLTFKFFHFEFSSDLLAGISIITAVILGQYLAGALVVLMLSGGQALELYAVGRASFLLKALSARMPNIAHQKQQEQVIDIAIEEIKIKDVLAIYPHEICPVDGVVLEGHGIMDESYLTGEPFLISKIPGAEVLSGAINGDTMLIIQATKKASDSRYAKIMKVMLESEQKKPRLRRLGDRLGAFYTPFALIIALMAWFLSGDVLRFLAVLVIATPCPLLIAIPVAIIGAISLSANRGIIIKNPVVLEQISNCRTMIFDKTGTLTYGKPLLTEISCFNHFSKEEILQLSASLEYYSKHPLANPIIEAAKKSHLSLLKASQMSEKSGEGLKGVVNNHQLMLTSRSSLIKQGKQREVDLLPQASGLECILLIDDQLAAHFRFHDTPRHESRSFITHLTPNHQFKKIMIVSGDRESEVRYLADEIGISKIYASQTPEQKVQIVEMENQKEKVIYLGDGINDAPALAVATVGIAFGQKNEIIAEAADAVLMENSLEKVDELLHISYRMHTIALQSAVGGIALSLIGMLFAAFGYLTPVIGAVLQELIDVFAVLNALRVAFPKNKLTDF